MWYSTIVRSTIFSQRSIFRAEKKSTIPQSIPYQVCLKYHSVHFIPIRKRRKLVKDRKVLARVKLFQEYSIFLLCIFNYFQCFFIDISNKILYRGTEGFDTQSSFWSPFDCVEQPVKPTRASRFNSFLEVGWRINDGR